MCFERNTESRGKANEKRRKKTHKVVQSERRSERLKRKAETMFRFFSRRKKTGTTAPASAFRHDLCAACCTAPRNGYFDLCASCYAAWHASPDSTAAGAAPSGGPRPFHHDLCAACRTAPRNGYYDLCSACYAAWHAAPDSTVAGTPPRAPAPECDEAAAGSTANPRKRAPPALWTRVTDPERIPHEDDDNCPICLCPLRDDDPDDDGDDDDDMNDDDDKGADGDAQQQPVVQLAKCGHFFHEACIAPCVCGGALRCPVCQAVAGLLTGTQPPGTMRVTTSRSALPGYPRCGTIVVSYDFPDGTQGPEHPHPGVPYAGTARQGFFPDNAEGRKVVRLLQLAWQQRVLFTVGRSMTTGCDNCVVWNGIHHKTSTTGGPTAHGYPDPTYLSRVQEELASFGITEEYL